MANKKPLVAGQSPAVVQQIGSSDTLDVPEIKLGTPLAAQYGGLGVDASLWASGKIPVFDGSQFAPGDPSGGSLPAGEKDQILVMGASGPEWGGSFPIDGGWVPPLEFVGMYRAGNYYTTSQAVYAMVNDYGDLFPAYLTPINNGTPSYPYTSENNVRFLSDLSPPQPQHEWQELTWPVSPPRFALGQYANAGDNATALGQYANAGDSATALGQYANAGDGSTALGQSAGAASNATAVGHSAIAYPESVALGQSANTGEFATAVGTQAGAGSGATVVGQSANASFFATAIGLQATASEFSTVIGAGAVSAEIGSTVIGVVAVAHHQRAAILGAVDENQNYQPSTTADRRMTVDYQELEVINQGDGGQTAVILVDEIGGQWRITVNSSGVISASAV